MDQLASIPLLSVVIITDSPEKNIVPAKQMMIRFCLNGTKMANILPRFVDLFYPNEKKTKM